jgi:hypothetical protein
VDSRSERIQQRLELPMTIAALLVIPLLVIEGSDYGEAWRTVADLPSLAKLSCALARTRAVPLAA